MKVTVSSLTLPGVLLGNPNPLPAFMSKNRQVPLQDFGLLPEEKEGFGNETGFRSLPYLIQDNYTREKRPVTIKTIILENEVLRATFLPEYGARLYSLYNKEQDRELLYVNPVFQPANLAIRNAWFSGGIEWNIGHYGHTFLTMEDYFAVVCSNNGVEFLRFYEYERCKRVFVQMDFHLFPGYEHLTAHIRIQNTRNESIPMYWWTNIALPEDPNVRILSGTREVIYMKPKSLDGKDRIHGFAHGSMPYLESLGGIDASYPRNFHFSNEYFFQNLKRADCTWEAACYDDGNIFYERSTENLRYRKMFCWGTHKGGRRWKEFLSTKDTGNYVEIQAGLAPTQVHGFTLEACETISFTQVFGSTKDASKCFQDDWQNASYLSYNLINERISCDQLIKFDNFCTSLATLQSDNIIHPGSGWGALEAELDPKKIPQHLVFPSNTLGEEQEPWLHLLKKGFVLSDEKKPWPISYMTDPIWLDLLQISIVTNPTEESLNLILISIGQWENGKFYEAIRTMENALNLSESPFALRCMSMILRENGEYKKAVHYMEKAIACFCGKIPHRAFAEEFIQLVLENDDCSKAWDFYENLDEQYKQEERIVLLIARAALKLKKWDFLKQQFTKEFAIIREGDNSLSDIYKEFVYMSHEENTESKLDSLSRDNFMAAIVVPENIDFRMFS
jgi:tetratricopeptide (TPR) repeat protein